jgi:hypothetical protein
VKDPDVVRELISELSEDSEPDSQVVFLKTGSKCRLEPESLLGIVPPRTWSANL